MRNLMFIVFMFTALSLQASPFKLKNELKEKLELLQGNSPSQHIQSTNYQTLQSSIFSKIFNSKHSSTNLYDFIQDNLEDSYQGVSKDLISHTLQDNFEFDMGVQSSNGFTWQKPIGFLKVETKRYISQSYRRSDQSWKVSDFHVISFNAKTFLEKLIEVNLIETAQATLNALANVQFSRTIQFDHYHSSYDEALKSEPKKLFLPFTYIEDLNLKISEKIAVSDNFNFKANADLNGTWTPYIEFGLSAAGSYDLIRKSSIEKKTGNFFDMRKMKSENFDFKLGANLKLSLFSLLKLTLLDFGFYTHVSKNTQEAYLIHEMLAPKQVLNNYLNFLPIRKSQRAELYKFKKFTRQLSEKKNGFHFDFFGINREALQGEAALQYISPKKKYTLGKNIFQRSRKKKTFWGYFKSSIIESLLGFNLDMNLVSTEDLKIESEYIHLGSEKTFHEIHLKNYQRIKKKKDFKKVLDLIKKRTNLHRSLNTRELLPKLKRAVINTLNMKISEEVLINIDKYITQKKIKNLCLTYKKSRKCQRKISKSLKKIKKYSIGDSRRTKRFHKFIHQLLKLNIYQDHIVWLIGEENIFIQGRLAVRVNERSKFYDYKHGEFKEPKRSIQIENLLLAQ